MTMEKQSLFISYCWKDGNIYADELETQLKTVFDVKRDKSQLIANDDIFDFMSKIAECDNVVIVLTKEYVVSMNCMLEMAFLLEQVDWDMKAMILVIDESLYSIERKLEIINYWSLRQKRCSNEMSNDEVGKTIWEEEKNYIDIICRQVERFFKGLSIRKNPSQIAIVNEIINKSKRDKEQENELVIRGEDAVKKFIEERGNVTLKELAEGTNSTALYARRSVSNLLEKGIVKKVVNGKDIRYVSTVENKVDSAIFSKRFIILQKLLNDSRVYNEKEYTLEYMSSFVGVKNVGEIKEYVNGDSEPDEEFKQRFVDVFGVNRDWMLYNQGDYPFETNLKNYSNGEPVFDNRPMDILRNENLSEIKEFVIVVGSYEHRRSVLIIRKKTNLCYELYPRVYDLDPNVGAGGRSRLVSFYRFLREANKIGKINGIVYQATEKQFRDLYIGAVAPMIVRKYEVFKYFTEDFIDLSPAQFERDERFWDEDLVEVKRIIQSDIENVDRFNNDSDTKRIQMNMEERN